MQPSSYHSVRPCGESFHCIHRPNARMLTPYTSTLCVMLGRVPHHSSVFPLASQNPCNTAKLRQRRLANLNGLQNPWIPSTLGSCVRNADSELFHSPVRSFRNVHAVLRSLCSGSGCGCSYTRSRWYPNEANTRSAELLFRIVREYVLGQPTRSRPKPDKVAAA